MTNARFIAPAVLMIASLSACHNDAARQKIAEIEANEAAKAKAARDISTAAPENEAQANGTGQPQ